MLKGNMPSLNSQPCQSPNGKIFNFIYKIKHFKGKYVFASLITIIDSPKRKIKELAQFAGS